VDKGLAGFDESQGAPSKEPLIVGYWHCEACGDGGAAPTEHQAGNAAVVHAIKHRASSRMARGLAEPVFLRTWTTSRVA
jgi:hypothetical protein